MIYLLLILFCIPHLSLADIFSKPVDQAQLDTVLLHDSKNYYYRGGYDYNAYYTPQVGYRFDKDDIGLGAERFNFHESLKNILIRPEFEGSELNGIMNVLKNSSFMTWQYSSPTLADFYKHLYTNGYLRLANMYQQYQDVERDIDDPIIKLRKQSLIDCMKRSGNLNDMNLAIKTCIDNFHSNGVYAALQDPGNGSAYIVGTVNVTDRVLNRVKLNTEELTGIEEIIPQVLINKDSVHIRGPVKQSRGLVAQYRKEFLIDITNIIQEYKTNRNIDHEKLSTLSVYGVPLTEGQVKNIAMLDDTVAYLSMNKIASGLAYLKTTDQYLQASQMLDRVMNHPAIESGYKILLKSSVDFVQKEIITLKEERDRLNQYADTMHAILDEADRQRLKALAWMKQDDASKKEKGLLNLNP